MKRKRWAEAMVLFDNFKRLHTCFVWQGQTPKRLVKLDDYSHRRSARRAAIQWAKRNGYELRWV